MSGEQELFKQGFCTVRQGQSALTLCHFLSHLDILMSASTIAHNICVVFFFFFLKAATAHGKLHGLVSTGCV